VFAALPLGVIAATPRLHDGGRLAVRLGDSLLPVSSAVGIAASTDGSVVHLKWRPGSSNPASVFYRVFRARGVDVACGGRLRNSSDDCRLYTDEVGSVRVPTFADRPGPGNWTYRVGVSANWLNDLQLGDVYVVSPPLTVTVR
jgi:hypothetical protein